MSRTFLVFFLSGLGALAHESVWARKLTRLLGSDADGVAIVLAVYMLGLGLGARLFASWTQKTERPGRLLAGLEAWIGLWAMASPWLLDALDPVRSQWGRMAISALVLLPPTLAMGATFPLMGRLSLGKPKDSSTGLGESTGSSISLLYGVNTLGACAGALLAPFVLMPSLGLNQSLLASGGISLLAAALAIGVGATSRAPISDERLADNQTAPRHAAAFLLATFLLGLSALSLEVLLTRLLITVTGASVYAFALVLFVFLLGIGLGSSQVAARLRASASALKLLFQCALWIPAATLAGCLVLQWQLGEGDLFAGLGNRMPNGAATWKLWLSHALFAAWALLFPAFLFGAALPAAASAVVASYAKPHRNQERGLANTYAANTAGALCGSLLASWFLLPVMGLRLGLGTALLFASIAALLLFKRARVPATQLALGLGSALALATWVLGKPIWQTPSHNSPVQVIAEAVGKHASASVIASTANNAETVRSLRVNGKVVATSAPVDLRLQRVLGLLPGLLHGQPKTGLVIGLGTGMTAGSLLAFPSLEQLQVVEISSAVLQLVDEFGNWNENLIHDARTQVQLADGRHALHWMPERFDVVTADPIHPWTRGSSDLFCVEHFRALAARLSEGGVASQWLPLYQLSEADVQVVIASWCEAFPHTAAWLTAYDLALVGAQHSLESASQDLLTGAWSPRVKQLLVESGIHNPAELAALQVADDQRLRSYAQGQVEPMFEDRPVLEFRAPKSFLSGYAEASLDWSAQDDFVAQLPDACQASALAVRALVRKFLGELDSGLGPAAERFGERLLELGNSPVSD